MRLDDNPPGGEAGEIGHEELAAERALTDIHLDDPPLSACIAAVRGAIGKPGPVVISPLGFPADPLPSAAGNPAR